MKITGIEIGEKAIRMAVLQQTWSASVVETCVSEVVPAGETFQQTIWTLSSQFPLSKDVIISIPRQCVFMKLIEMPCLKDVDLKKALEYEAEEHIPYPIHDVVYDFCVIKQEEKEEKAKKTRVLLVSAQKAVVKSYIEMIKGVDRHDISVSVSSLALLSLCLSQEEEKDWMLCYGEERGGRGKECQEIFVVRDGFLSLIQTVHGQEVEREIARIIENHPVKKIILAGNVSKQLSVQAEKFVIGKPDSIKIAAHISDTSPVPIALALNRLCRAPLRINLNPEREIQAKRALNKQLKTTGILLLLLVCCMNLLFLLCIKRMESRLQLMMLEINRIQPKVVNLVDNKASIEQLTKNMEKLKAVILDTPCYLDALNELAVIVSTQTRLEGVNIQGRKCRLTGDTSSVTTFLTAIEKSSAFEQVELVGGITREMGMERFEIQMLVKG